jgi:hypothetical protein
MANLKLNNVIAIAESAGVTTLQNTIIKASTIKANDGTAALTISDSTGALSLSSTLAVTGTSTLTGNVTAAGDLTVTGGLTVNGTTTTINSTTLSVDDKNIEMGSVASPSDTTADGGGLTLKGATDKTISWVNATDAWTFNQHLFPSADNASDLGSSAKRWRNIYTTDLHLANERGNWTVIEEEDYLTLRNNKTDKVYKLVMEEIE